MTVIITAGGTSEKIDEIRKISNNSTGALGAKIAEAFLALGDSVDKIFYVCGAGALTPPDSKKIELIIIESVNDLKNALEQIILKCKIEAVIHCMAVSDFTKRNVTTAKRVSDGIIEGFEKNRELSRDELKKLIYEYLYEESGLDADGKISSDVDDLIINLIKTPKIISMLRSKLPEAVLVGFKLLNNAEHDLLIDTAFKLLKKNDCDFVFANDSKDISPANHIGYLVSGDGSYLTLSGREEIAEGIALAVKDKLLGGKK